MKLIRITFSLLLVGVLFACGSSTSENNEGTAGSDIVLESLNKENLLKEIARREEVLNNDTSGIDKQKAKELMDAYIVFSERFSSYEGAADNLFKAGEIAMGLNMTAEAIRCFDKVFNDFSDYEKRPYALFLKAFVLENQAQNFEEAKRIYQLFLVEFPTHEMADDAEYSIKNIGKSPEELIREFEIQDSIKKAKEQV